MKRFLVSVFFIIFSFLLQTTVFHGLAFGGIVPNLMIVITVSLGLIRGEQAGLLTGFFCGLLADIFFGETLGLNSLIYMYIGYTNGKLNRMFYPEDIKLPLGMIVVSDLAYGLLYYMTMFLMRARFHFSYYFINVILPEMVYTILVTLLFYPFILKVHKLLEASEKRGARKFV